MKPADYLDRLLLRYAGTFDIYQPYVIRGREYPAYGYFFSHIEKYVLVREANMWTSDSYEHVIFMEAEQVTEQTIAEADSIIREYMEPVLVRKGQKCPEPNHMYSYLTVVMLSEKAIDAAVVKKVKRYTFEKGYRFNIRGFSQGHLTAVSLEDEKVYTNNAARKGAALFKEVFKEVREGRQGFASHIAENQIVLKKQKDVV